MPRLTAKLMEEKLNQGWTYGNFATLFNTDKDHFICMLERAFSKSAYNIYITRLDKHQKKRKNYQKRAKNKNKDLQPAKAIHEKESIPLNVELENKINELKVQLINEESTHQNFISERKQLKIKLVEKKDEINQILDTLENLENEVNKISTKLSTLNTKIAESNLKSSSLANELNILERQLESLRKVSILVYNTGEFEVENYSEDFPEPELKTFETITSCEAAENLTIKQIKAFCPVISLSKKLKEAERDFEITFEVPEMETLYNLLIS